MKTNTRILFWIIVLLTVGAVLIDLPKTIPVSINTTIPIINQKIELNKNFSGFDPNILLNKINIQKDFSFKRGLDLDGGTSVTLTADMKDIPQDQRSNALESAKNVIERRVNFLGVSEPVIQTATVNNDYRIIVELPGVTNVNEAVNLIGTTAQLTFWEEVASGSAEVASSSALPLGMSLIFPNANKTDLTGSDLSQTTVVFDPNTSTPQVQLSFNTSGAKKFEAITKRNVGKRVAIVLDNMVIEAPVVNQTISGGTAVITGNFTTDTANSLSIQLNAGALPVPLSILEQKTVGATLGDESMRKSTFAGVLGFIVVVIFMIALYGRLGVIASISLFLYALYVLAIFKLIPVTLTLAGIAGFVLSIGMAVDANILIFERMREELRRGKSKQIAMELGFSRAWSSIRDSNISSIITSLILIYFGTGIVRGFAITLLIGVLVSMFSAIIITRTFLRLMYK